MTNVSAASTESTLIYSGYKEANKLDSKFTFYIPVYDNMEVNEEDIDKGKYRYRSYPSARMFSTFNVWDDMMHGRLPNDMKLFGWILFALIVDLVAFILRILAR